MCTPNTMQAARGTPARVRLAHGALVWLLLLLLPRCCCLVAEFWLRLVCVSDGLIYF